MMRLMQAMIRAAALAIGLALLSACSIERLIPDRRPDYRDSRVEEMLEIPPDLSTSAIDDSLVGSGAQANVGSSFSAYNQSSTYNQGSSTYNQGVSTADTQGSAAAAPAPLTQSGQRARVIQVQSGHKALLIEEGYSQSWRLVGLALDSNRLAVEAQDPGRGLYVVDYSDSGDGAEDEGWLSKLAFWKDDAEAQHVRYQVRLVGQGPQTLVAVYDAAGNLDSSPAALYILDSLAQVIR